MVIFFSSEKMSGEEGWIISGTCHIFGEGTSGNIDSSVIGRIVCQGKDFPIRRRFKYQSMILETNVWWLIFCVLKKMCGEEDKADRQRRTDRHQSESV